MNNICVSQSSSLYGRFYAASNSNKLKNDLSAAKVRLFKLNILLRSTLTFRSIKFCPTFHLS